jgi:hypothetical protein
MPTLSTRRQDRQSLDEELVVELEPPEPEPLELEELELSDFVAEDEPLDDDPPSELDDVEVVSLDVFESLESLLPDSLPPDAGVADFLPRLSVLKNPEPLKVTPTGVNTFFTGMTSPESGWAISVRFSSWKPCWTSMVSPVSTNLYT